MSSLINWQVALARADELRRIGGAVDARPFARFRALGAPSRETAVATAVHHRYGKLPDARRGSP